MIRLYIFDVDGTLRYTTRPGARYPIRSGEQRLLPGVADRLRRIRWNERRLGIASNQEGVGEGLLCAARARRLIEETLVAAIGFLPAGTAIEMCTCPASVACPRRKPNPGLLLSVLGRASVLPEQALFVGDLASDAEAARRAGVAFAWAKEFFGSSRA